MVWLRGHCAILVHTMRSLITAATLVLALGAAAVSAETIRFKPSKGASTYTVREPVLKVTPGDIVETSTLWSDWYAGKDAPWPGEVGPIYVAGAEPGDTLEIRILRIRPNASTGRSGTSETYGSLTATTATPMLNEPVPAKTFVWQIAPDGRTATLALPNSRLGQARVELQPMLGRIATAPPGEQSIPAGVPAAFGGNLDSPQVREGATVLLPVFHQGAYLYFGDVHALQGDGEIIGSGIETTADVALEIRLRKKKTIAWPRIEDRDWIMVAGSARPLIDAFRIAHVEMVKWLESEFGFDRWEALQLLSQVGRAEVANVVDPNFTVLAKFPKRHLPPVKD